MEQERLIVGPVNIFKYKFCSLGLEGTLKKKITKRGNNIIIDNGN